MLPVHPHWYHLWWSADRRTEFIATQAAAQQARSTVPGDAVGGRRRTRHPGRCLRGLLPEAARVRSRFGEALRHLPGQPLPSGRALWSGGRHRGGGGSKRCCDRAREACTGGGTGELGFRVAGCFAGASGPSGSRQCSGRWRRGGGPDKWGANRRERGVAGDRPLSAVLAHRGGKTAGVLRARGWVLARCGARLKRSAGERRAPRSLCASAECVAVSLSDTLATMAEQHSATSAGTAPLKCAAPTRSPAAASSPTLFRGRHGADQTRSTRALQCRFPRMPCAIAVARRQKGASLFARRDRRSALDWIRTLVVHSRPLCCTVNWECVLSWFGLSTYPVSQDSFR